MLTRLYTIGSMKTPDEQTDAVGFAEKGWWRGPAHIEDGYVVLDDDEVEWYWHLGADESVAFDLAGIDSPDQIVEFVARWGLLWSGPQPPYTESLREPVSHWLSAAATLKEILTLGTLTRLAGGGQEGSMARLRDHFKDSPSALLGEGGWGSGQEGFSNEAVLRGSSQFVSTFVNRAAANVRWSIFDASNESGTDFPVGTFIPVLDAPDVYNVAILRAAVVLTRAALPSICPGCGLPFTPTDGRQKYHSAECGDRVRYRRWYEKNRRG